MKRALPLVLSCDAIRSEGDLITVTGVARRGAAELARATCEIRCGRVGRIEFVAAVGAVIIPVATDTRAAHDCESAVRDVVGSILRGDLSLNDLSEVQ